MVSAFIKNQHSASNQRKREREDKTDQEEHKVDSNAPKRRLVPVYNINGSIQAFIDIGEARDQDYIGPSVQQATGATRHLEALGPRYAAPDPGRTTAEAPQALADFSALRLPPPPPLPPRHTRPDYTPITTQYPYANSYIPRPEHSAPTPIPPLPHYLPQQMLYPYTSLPERPPSPPPLHIQPPAISRTNVHYPALEHPPLPQQQNMSTIQTSPRTIHPQIPPSSTKNQPVIYGHEGPWDGWPDGVFSRDFTYQEFKETKKLQVHWACQALGGFRGGDERAKHWEEGKKNGRKCLGIIRCINPRCAIIIRPQTTSEGVEEQLSGQCSCGSDLVEIECAVRSHTWRWKHGVHYEHEGFHSHVRPTHILHFTKEQERRFDALVHSHPDVKPLKLIMGLPCIDKPGESVTKISDIFLNAHRVAKARTKVLKGRTGPGIEPSIEKWAEFQRLNPGFVVHEHSDNGVIVKCFQSPFMQSQIIKEERLEQPVNGLVSDAAHGWWKERNYLLMVSSTYCPDLQCWVPGLMSFVNGASTDHFEQHFFALFLGIAFEAKERGIEVADTLFVGNMDLSQPQRIGYERAFIRLWVHVPDPMQRTEVELVEAAGALLRACIQHFRTGLIRLSKVVTSIADGSSQTFLDRGFALLHSKDTDEFRENCNVLLVDYPDIKPWMAWYKREPVARMLFKSERTMEASIWDSIPETTNAEEAMHWKLYAGLGHDHDFFYGIEAILKAAQHFEQCWRAAKQGFKLRHGKAEHWKVTKLYTKTTKPGRVAAARRGYKKTDGRGPDTLKALMAAKKKEAKKKATKEAKKKVPKKGTKAAASNNRKKSLQKKAPTNSESEALTSSDDSSNSESDFDSKKSTSSDSDIPLALLAKKPKGMIDVCPFNVDIDIHSFIDLLTTPVDPLSRPSYPWFRNSCWLDTSLQHLYVTFERLGPKDLEEALSDVPDDSWIRATVLHILRQRLELHANLDDASLSKKLRAQRDTFRTVLRHRRLIKTLDSDSPMVRWITHSIESETVPRASAYFEFRVIEIHRCSGSPETGDEYHVELTEKPHRTAYLSLAEEHHTEVHGDLTRYVQSFLAVDKPRTACPCCWRVTSDGAPICIGSRVDIRDLVISIPVILIIEIQDLLVWNISSTILVPTSTQIPGATYSLASLGIYSKKKGHFKCRYLSTDQSNVYTYDDMVNGGIPILETGSPETHFYGRDIAGLDGDWKVTHAFYYLQGGYKAQNRFYEERISAVTKMHALTFSSPNLNEFTTVSYPSDTHIRMFPGKRNWKKQANKTRTAEYVHKDSPDPYAKKDSEITKKTPETAGKNAKTSVGKPGMTDEANTFTKNKPSTQEDLPVRPSEQRDISPPNTDFEINCRCGTKGDGNIGYNVNHSGEVIGCDICREWMHIACQRGQGDLPKNEKFECERCNIPNERIFGARKSTRRTGLNKAPYERLRVGHAALVKDGHFWYPARIMQRVTDPNIKQSTKTRNIPIAWRVKWWRGCHFVEGSIYAPNVVSTVPVADVVDGLWGNREARRKIRLGKWDHAFKSPTDEDILADPSSLPYSKTVDDSLRPHKNLLHQLLQDPEKVDKNLVPAIAWVEKTRGQVRIDKNNAPMAWVEVSKRSISTTIFVSAGGLSVVEQGEISNWIEVNICGGDRKLREYWLTKLPNAHANTLYLADRLRTSETSDVDQLSWQRKAWNVLLTAKQTDAGVVDVDREAVVVLEEVMLEDSKKAGIAGSQQWGLDAGDHQACWGVYVGLPESWRPGDREGSDGEYERGPAFVSEPRPQVVQKGTGRPYPKPRRKLPAQTA